MLRGVAIVIMILVDALPDFEAAYPLLLHSPWEGISLADLAFPGFAFVMGMSAAFSFAGHGEEAGAVGRCLWRAAKLFGLGMVFNMLGGIWALLLTPGFDGAAFYENFIVQGRIWGVLQRLALAYVLVMMLCFTLRRTGWLLLSACGLLLAFSAGFHFYAPQAPFAQQGSLSQALDLMLLGENHIYHGYGWPFDPEGLYGTLGTACSVLFGVLTGRLVRESSYAGQRWLALLLGGGALLMAGWFWSGYDIVSKPLWTAPFVLLTAGVYMLLLLMVDMFLQSLPRLKVLFRPLQAFGMNPIFFYFVTNMGLIFLWTLTAPDGSGPCYVWLWQEWSAGLANRQLSIALHAACWCILWWPLAEYLFRKKIFIKL